jgi:hypothetical protein
MNNDMRQVAIKRIDWKKQLAINGPKIEEVLNREIATMQKLDQRNIVRLYDTLVCINFCRSWRHLFIGNSAYLASCI